MTRQKRPAKLTIIFCFYFKAHAKFSCFLHVNFWLRLISFAARGVSGPGENRLKRLLATGELSSCQFHIFHDVCTLALDELAEGGKVRVVFERSQNFLGEGVEHCSFVGRVCTDLIFGFFNSFQVPLRLASFLRQPNRNLRIKTRLFRRTVQEQAHDGHDLPFVDEGAVLGGSDVFTEKSHACFLKQSTGHLLDSIRCRIKFLNQNPPDTSQNCFHPNVAVEFARGHP